MRRRLIAHAAQERRLGRSVRDGRRLAILRGHTATVLGAAFDSDGRLLSWGADGTVRIWEAISGALRRTLRGDRRYERLDITGLIGVTEAQRQAMRALGAVERIDERVLT